MSLLDKISARTVDRSTAARTAIDMWIDQYLLPANQFTYNGTTYPFGLNTTWSTSRQKEIANSLPGYLGALRGCPPAFAAQMVRAVVLSQARFTFRNLPSQPNARKMFGTRALGILEKPWPRATTGQLIARMEWHAGLAGNAYVYKQPDRLRVLRPDWVSILFGSQREPDDPLHALDGEVIGYVYQNGGIGSPTGNPQTLLPDEVAHWSPQPDPERAEIGMSWITPALRDIQADQAATEHKIQFFAHGATPNLVVKGIPAATQEQFNEIVDSMEARHAGVMNAYRTLYLTAGADATVVGANLSEINIGGVQGASETRISFLSRVPAALLGIQDGMKGSSLNAGNYAETRRTFSDSWIYPTLQDLCASLAPMLDVPAGAELWFDPADMPILREDSKDAAQIEQVKSVTITTYVKEGFTPESAIAAVRGQDITLLKHSGMVSVQLQPPGSTAPDAGGGAGPKAPTPPAERKFNPAQPRRPDGEWGTGGVIHDLAKLGDLLGSRKVSGDNGEVHLALTKDHDGQHLHLTFPVDESDIGPAPMASLDSRNIGVLRDGLDELDQMGRERVKAAQKIADRMDAAEPGSAEYKAAQDAYFEIAGDGQLIGEGSARGENGESIAYQLVMTDEPSLYIGVHPADAPADWDLQTEVDNGEGARFTNREFQRLRKQLGDLTSEAGTRAAGHDTTPGHDELRVGPHGYEHGWVFVGVPGPGHHTTVIAHEPKLIPASEANAWGRASFTPAKELPPNEREALRLYSGGAYHNVNKVLRGNGTVGPTNRREAERVIAEVDKAMKHERVPEDIVTSRAVGLDTFGGDPSKFVGKVLADKGYLSTTVGDTVKGVAGRQPVHLRIEVPKGTPGYYMRDVSQFKEEKELLLGRGQRLAITAAKQDPRTGRWTVTAKILAH